MSRRMLLGDPDTFRGQIIALKDGCNMARRTPVADGLERQLRLLTDHGYRVVTVSELLERAPREMARRRAKGEPVEKLTDVRGATMESMLPPPMSTP